MLLIDKYTLSDVNISEVKLKNKCCTPIPKLNQRTKQSDAVYL
jgi:hypothetical protein